MATNKYFNPMGNTARQGFIEKLIIQSIKAIGLDMLYIPRQILEDDAIYEEARHQLFSDAKELEFAVEDIMNFNGDGHSFMVGFAMEDTVTVVVSQKRFKDTILQARPLEDDLVYIQEADQIFQVDKVYEDTTWREWGQNYVWRIKMTRFRYGHEEMETGDPDIDNLEVFADGDEDIAALIQQIDALEHDINAIPDSLDAEGGYNPPYQAPQQPSDTADDAVEESQTPGIDIKFGD